MIYYSNCVLYIFGFYCKFKINLNEINNFLKGKDNLIVKKIYLEKKIIKIYRIVIKILVWIDVI